MSSYDVPLVIAVEAECYDDAVSFAKQAEGGGISVLDAFEHDNDGQRVFYLHPEDEPWDLVYEVEK